RLHTGVVPFDRNLRLNLTVFEYTIGKSLRVRRPGIGRRCRSTLPAATAEMPKRQRCQAACDGGGNLGRTASSGGRSRIEGSLGLLDVVEVVDGPIVYCREGNLQRAPQVGNRILDRDRRGRDDPARDQSVPLQP